MTIEELIKGNHEITAVIITFRNKGKLQGMWKIGKAVKYTEMETATMPTWASHIPKRDFYRETKQSINYRTDGKDHWGYNGKLPKEAAKLEVDMWTCWYFGRDMGSGSTYALHVTVEEAVPEEKKPAQVEEVDPNQITLFDIGGM